MMWPLKKKIVKKEIDKANYNSTEEALMSDDGFNKEINNLSDTIGEYFEKNPNARQELWSVHKYRIFNMNDARNHDNVIKEVDKHD